MFEVLHSYWPGEDVEMCDWGSFEIRGLPSLLFCVMYQHIVIFQSSDRQQLWMIHLRLFWSFTFPLTHRQMIGPDKMLHSLAADGENLLSGAIFSILMMFLTYTLFSPFTFPSFATSPHFCVSQRSAESSSWFMFWPAMWTDSVHYVGCIWTCIF